MILLVLIWAILANLFAYQKGFYRLPTPSKGIPHVLTLQLIFCFAIYLSLAMLAAPILVRIVFWLMKKGDPALRSMPIASITGIQLLTMVAIFVLLQKLIGQKDRPLLRKLWNQREAGTLSFFSDFGIGCCTWFLSFPIVTAIGTLTEWLLKKVELKPYEQTAVRFVKTAAESTPALIFALISVLIMAPLIEEFLFRGVLQTHLKSRLGTKAAILLSALCFALFHFSLSQGLGNIPLIISLSILGGFLGFLYEKQGSLWASIGLHTTFNTVSAFRILLIAEVQ